jgi:hypothetical protein
VRLQAARTLSSSIFFDLPSAVSQTRLWLKFCSPTPGLVAAATHLPWGHLAKPRFRFAQVSALRFPPSRRAARRSTPSKPKATRSNTAG